ncbi:MAG: hypothetical protein NXI22_00110 [bacterium]|nr:hypothetical protein [bacterium]
MFDRAPDGSPQYHSEPIPDDNFVEMRHDPRRDMWVAEIELDPKAHRADFFSNHRKTVQYAGESYSTYISSPYTRVEFGE